MVVLQLHHSRLYSYSVSNPLLTGVCPAKSAQSQLNFWATLPLYSWGFSPWIKPQKSLKSKHTTTASSPCSQVFDHRIQNEVKKQSIWQEITNCILHLRTEPGSIHQNTALFYRMKQKVKTLPLLLVMGFFNLQYSKLYNIFIGYFQNVLNI